MNSLFRKKIIICMGSGGVGKTTVSAALGVAAAKLGLRVLVLTIDPSKRLATALGLQNWDGEERRVEKLDGHLYAAMIEPKQIFDDFVKDTGASDAIIKNIFNNAFYRELSTSLSGTQEFTSLQALYKAQKSNKYDLIILDTPPAQHTLEFIESPQHIYDLFSGSVVEWFGNMTLKREGLFKFFHKGTLLTLSIFEKITGSQFLKEMETFFKIIAEFRVHVKTVSQNVLDLLSSPDTAFTLVSRLDYNKLYESEGIVSELSKRKFNLSRIFMNAVFPNWELDTPGDVMAQKFKLFCDKIKAYNVFQEGQLKQIMNKDIQILPFIPHDLTEIEFLEKLAHEIASDKK